MTQIHRLPNFENPPVAEVAASVQFEPLQSLDAVRLGLLWQRFRDIFPNVEQKPPLAPVVERLGVRSPLNHVQFQVSEDIGVPRLWFVNEAGDELIQVQSDRFIRNWRGAQFGRPYPRYDQHIRPKFAAHYLDFQSFVDRELKEKIEANQCELTYINRIRPCEHWSTHKDLSAVFRGWNSSYVELIEQPVEAINVRAVHVLNGQAGEFIGRLHVVLQSAFKAHQSSESEEPIFLLTLTARGKPIGEGINGILEFFDLGRRAIVTAFDRMTTPEMHREWGRRYDS